MLSLFVEEMKSLNVHWITRWRREVRWVWYNSIYITYYRVIYRKYSLQAFLDKIHERKVLGLKVKCNNHGDGCAWMGELRDLQVSQLNNNINLKSW